MAVSQRWDGMGYSLADFIHRKTDIFILTIFTSLSEVSVYSVYSIVTNGVNSVITMATNSFQAALGDMLAKGEKKNLLETMDLYVFIVHVISNIVFSIAVVMILPFISLYTKGINDVNYIRPAFAVLILTVEMTYCLRQPYQSLIIAAGRFKETQKGAILEAVFNIILSLILVWKFGMIGVTIGTFIAMIYRTLDLVFYLKHELVDYNINAFAKRYLISFAMFGCAVAFSILINFEVTTYLEWVICALFTSLIIIFTNCIVNWLFYKKEFKLVIVKLLKIKNK